LTEDNKKEGIEDQRISSIKQFTEMAVSPVH
jgi:hypothetical protein